MKNTVFFFSVLFYLSLSAFAQQLQCLRGVADYDFWLYLPEKKSAGEKPPVLLFLHGQNLCGSNLKYLTEGKTKGSLKKPPYGAICEIKNRGREFPAIVVGPQFPEGSNWNPDKLIDVLNYIQKKYDTDTSRVYVTGMSAGGFGTLRLAGKYTHRITAAAALCGGGDVEDACNLARIPLWVLCGTNDSKYFVAQSKMITDAIKQCDGGNQLRYSSLRGKTHSDMEEYFRTTDTLYNWLFSQRKTLASVPNEKQDAVAKPSQQQAEAQPKEKTKKSKAFYVVNIIAVSRESTAKAKAAELKKKGYASGYLWIPDYASLSGKKLYTVYIGPFSTQKDCESATEKFKKIYSGTYGSKVSQEKETVFIKGVGEVAVKSK